MVEDGKPYGVKMRSGWNRSREPVGHELSEEERKNYIANRVVSTGGSQHRISFLVAVRCSGVYNHPIPLRPKLDKR